MTLQDIDENDYDLKIWLIILILVIVSTLIGALVYKVTVAKKHRKKKIQPEKEDDVKEAQVNKTYSFNLIGVNVVVIWYSFKKVINNLCGVP